MKSILYVFLFLLNCIIVIQSQSTLDPAQYTCLQNLLTKIGTIGSVSYTSGYYQFCSMSSQTPIISVTCFNNKITALNLEQTSATIIESSDFICFGTLDQTYMTNFKSGTTFMTVWPTTTRYFTMTTTDTSLPDGIPFSPLSPYFTYVYFNVYSQPTIKHLPFSYFKNVSYTFNIISKQPVDEITSTSHQFYFDNDLVEPWNIPYFSLISMNLPSLENVISKDFSINLNPGYDQSSLVNLLTCTQMKTLTINSKDLSIFPISFGNFISISTETINFNVPFSKVTSLIDLSNVQGLKILGFDRAGLQFSLNGEFPFILPTSRLDVMSYQLGNLSRYDPSPFTNIVQLFSRNNGMKGDLPIFNRSVNKVMEFLDIFANLITGTLDRSYCEISVNVGNNKLTGEIPSCFTCFFNINSDFNKVNNFGNNLFTNYANVPPCTTIVPNIVYGGFNGTKQIYKIFGYDIGVNIKDSEKVLTTLVAPGYSCLWTRSLLDKEFICTMTSTGEFDRPKIMKLEYIFDGKNYSFTLSADPLPPQLETVDWSIQGNDIIINGSFFTYNISTVNITIGGNQCVITKASFYQISCTIMETFGQEEDILSYIKIGNLTTQFTLNQHITNTILNCTAFNDCNGNGYCLSDVGQCKCYQYYKGADCNDSYEPDMHYVSSVDPSTTAGGNVTFYGMFTESHIGLKVYIGEKECSDPVANSSVLVCIAPPGIGLYSIKVIQNSLNFNASNFYQYKEIINTCPNNCTSSTNGKCNTTNGYCYCNENWYGYDCSLYPNNEQGGSGGSNTTIDDNGNTIINNYQMSITKLLEIDFKGNIIKEFKLQDSWSIKSKLKGQNGDNVYKFIQSIQLNKCNITYTVEEIIKDKEVSFAGIDFKLNGGSVKMTVSIESYQYSSNLNTLQLQMISTVGENDEPNECNDDTVEINSITDKDNTLNYLTIKKDAKVLNGKFIDRVESDGRSTFMSTFVVSKSTKSIIVGMNLPHCVDQCLIDPSFEVLISPEFKSECGESKKPWLIPIAVIIPVVGVSILAATSYVIYKKKYVEQPFKNKLKELGIKNNK